MAKRFYHNITKNILNISDLGDFFDDYEEGDRVFYTIGGNALLSEITKDNLDKLRMQIDEDYE